MSHLMDYGDDWPPPREPAAPEPVRRDPERVDWAALGRRCVNAIALHMLIAGLGLGLLAVREASMAPRTVHTPADPPAPYEVTIESPAPHPAGVHERPVTRLRRG